MGNQVLTMIELFSGIGAQERALRQLAIPYSIVATCDLDKDAVLSYAAMRFDIDSAMNTYQFPTQDKMIEELQNKGFGYDFMKGKHTITSRTSINKLKQYYIADKLSNNLGDISKVERLPYADIVTYCQYGDTRMKPTHIFTNYPNPQFKHCKNGDPCHEKAPRGSRTGTQGIKGSVDRSRIPDKLCEYIVELCEKG